MTCYNRWETVSDPPVVQYWYITAPNVGNNIKADKVWNHLNLNGCAVTENKYYAHDDIKGAVLTFHASSACTADRVSKAIREGSDPGVNIACEFTGNKATLNPTAAGLQGGAAALDEVTIGILKGIGGL